MGRHITQQEVAEVRDYKLVDLVNMKGASAAVELIRQAIKNNMSIACIGEQGVGKTLLLRAILNDKGSFDTNKTLDEVIKNNDYELVVTEKCKYYTSNAASAQLLLDIIKQSTNRKTIPNTLVIKKEICKTDDGWVKRITSIEEIITIDGETIVNEIINIHKNKLHMKTSLSV